MILKKLFGDRRGRAADDTGDPDRDDLDTDAVDPDDGDEESDPDELVDVEADESDEDAARWEELDEEDWREDGPSDITEIDADEFDEPDPMRIDLGSLVLTGFEGMELRLQIAESTQQIVSALMISGDSALEVSAFAAPRSGGLWSELREEIMAATTEAGGSVHRVEGPFGTELRRLLPVSTPDGEQAYQPSRMWVAQGPRWCLRGVLYGQAAVIEGLEGPVEQLLASFRSIVVRRGDDAMAPGDLLPLSMPEGAQRTTAPEDD